MQTSLFMRKRQYSLKKHFFSNGVAMPAGIMLRVSRHSVKDGSLKQISLWFIHRVNIHISIKIVRLFFSIFRFGAKVIFFSFFCNLPCKTNVVFPFQPWFIFFQFVKEKCFFLVDKQNHCCCVYSRWSFWWKLCTSCGKYTTTNVTEVYGLTYTDI